ncbi:YihY/virulence factor BrkB family protein [Brachybacterium phenoliresistens]|uniref:YihY/virulence factor BrkB family protein n=1 Tax=Brachybacterium phenoliresistens TaxID=396014 RepID=UPI0006890BC1|nr:YihY/virulence factor BrkB family protein [Brachybacterium phenoliresistens]
MTAKDASPVTTSGSATSPAAKDRPRLTRATVVYMAKRVLTEFGRDGGTDHAAKLTYFMVLSVAPTLLAVFSLATLVLQGFQEQISQLIIDMIARSNPDGGQMNLEPLVTSTLESLMGSSTGGTVALIIGIATALWSASAYVKAYARVSNAMYDVPEGRGPIRMNGTMLAVTAALVLGILAIAISLLLSESIVTSLLGPIAEPIGATGLLTFLVDSFLPIWAWAKWPVVVLLMFVLISLLYWATPNIAKPFRLISPGGVFAILGIALALLALSLYMSTLASYSSYGAIGSIMAVLFALWVVNTVILLGAEVDAEYERARELAAGKPAEDSLALPLRAEAGAVKAEDKYQQVVDAGRDIRLRNLHHDAASYTGPEHRLTPPEDRASAPERED